MKNGTQCKVMYGIRKKKAYLKGKSFDLPRNKLMMSTRNGKKS